MGQVRKGRRTIFERKNAVQFVAERRLDLKDLATTYSRGTYRTTTIGKTVFDGRVRDGIGSGHSFMVTKKTACSPQTRFTRFIH